MKSLIKLTTTTPSSSRTTNFPDLLLPGCKDYLGYFSHKKDGSSWRKTRSGWSLVSISRRISTLHLIKHLFYRNFYIGWISYFWYLGGSNQLPETLKNSQHKKFELYRKERSDKEVHCVCGKKKLFINRTRSDDCHGSFFFFFLIRTNNKIFWKWSEPLTTSLSGQSPDLLVSYLLLTDKCLLGSCHELGTTHKLFTIDWVSYRVITPWYNITFSILKP